MMDVKCERVEKLRKGPKDFEVYWTSTQGCGADKHMSVRIKCEGWKEQKWVSLEGSGWKQIDMQCKVAGTEDCKKVKHWKRWVGIHFD